MKKIFLLALMLSVTVLVWGQPPAQQDTVKMATVFKNAEEVNKALTALQNASNIVINSNMPSKDAQQASTLIFSIVEFIQKNTIQYNSQPVIVTLKNGTKLKPLEEKK